MFLSYQLDFHVQLYSASENIGQFKMIVYHFALAIACLEQFNFCDQAMSMIESQ